MRRWWSLVGKEWRSSWTAILLGLAATVGFDAWLAVKAPAWAMKYSAQLAIGLSFIPFVGIGIAALVVGYYAVRNEWRDRTSMRLLSYPTSGASILSAKLLVAVLGLALIAVVATIGTWFVSTRSTASYSAMMSAANELIQLKPWERAVDIMWMVVCLILGTSFIVAVGIFSFVIGTIVPRISGLIAVAVYVLVWYLTFAFSPHAMYAFSFIPNPGLIIYTGIGSMATRQIIPLLPFWPTLIGTVVLVLAAGKILQSEVDA